MKLPFEGAQMSKKIASTVYKKIIALANSSPSQLWPTIAFLIDCFLHERKLNTFRGVEIQNPIHKQALHSLMRHGFYVLPNFISSEDCLNFRTSIDLAIQNHPELVHRGSTYDLRLYGIENISNSFISFNTNTLLSEIASSYLKCSARAAFTLGARMSHQINNSGSGGGWHRDSKFRQIKAIVYLSDVNQQNGPFQLIKDSQKKFQHLRDNYLAGLSYNEVRWSGALIERVLKNTEPSRLKSFNGKAGTLILVDTSTIHRGAPILEGSRYAMTNYYYPQHHIDHSIFAQFYPVAHFDERGFPKSAFVVEANN
jgi:hypothetical protein